LAHVKEIGDRLSSVEDQVQALSKVAGQLADLANQMKDSQAASAA